MIERLLVRDFILVDELEVSFGEGLTVLTGETGAGKSVLLQALGLLLGDRARRDTVRTGAREARVEAAFVPRGRAEARIRARLETAGVPWVPGEPLIVSRQVGADGRSRAFLNAAAVPVGVLVDVGACLVEVSSQHQHQGLLREDTHLEVLDAGLDAEGRAALAGWGRAVDRWRVARDEAERLERLEGESTERIDFLRFQADEIRSAALEVGEDDRLKVERDLLVHAEKLLEAYTGAEAEVYSASGAALERVARAARAVEGAATRDPGAGPVLDLLREAKVLLDEAASGLRERQGVLQVEPGRLEVLEDRLAVIHRLERKHGAGIEAILARLSALESELDEVERLDLALDDARRDRTVAFDELASKANALRRCRQRAAEDLADRVNAELEALSMGRSVFRVDLGSGTPPPQEPPPVRFLLAANTGEPPRPLARVASGGELSRILLGVRNAVRDDGVGTLVFDEVDAGVGGVVADAVGDRLVRLAETCQVVCITHLPQIASRAAHHCRVEKVVEDGRTRTRVVPLPLEDRVDELARMLGGRRVTETSRRHARELVERSGS